MLEMASCLNWLQLESFVYHSLCTVATCCSTYYTFQLFVFLRGGDGRTEAGTLPTWNIVFEVFNQISDSSKQ